MMSKLLKSTPCDIDQEALQALTNELSWQYWNEPCPIPVTWNGRLKRTMGRFIYGSNRQKQTNPRIEMSKHAAKYLDNATFVAVILHELCHYHLYRQNQPFADHHPFFEKELRRVGAISTNRVHLPQKAYELFCTSCQQSLGTRKRINTHHYRSKCCQAKILKKEATFGHFYNPGS